MACAVGTVFLALSALAAACHGATILAVFSSLSFSDHLIFRGYVQLLAERQHHVVVMTPFPGKFQYPEAEHITELDVSKASAPFVEEYKRLVTDARDYLSVLPQLNDLSIRLAAAQIRSEQMSSLFKDPKVKFDLVITEADVPLLYAIAEKYKAPHVSITAGHGKINMYDSKGNPNHPLLYPDVYTLEYGNLTVWQKTIEVERHLRFRYEYYYRYLPASDAAARQLLGLQRALQEVEYDIDLLLVSGTHMLVGNRPTVPAIIYVDRLHIQPHLSPQNDINVMLDAFKQGFVYFSLGAMQSSGQLPPQTMQALMATLGELPVPVLWKMDNFTEYKAPENIIFAEWFPQQEVLAHPNIKAFITHGGPRSLEESIYYEVPIVVVPTVAGTKVFAQRVVQFGGGLVLDPYYLGSKEMKDAVLTIIKNSKYKKAMSKLKYLAFDQPMSGPERAVWWTEYVLRHKGAPHLRAPAVGVPMYKYFMLDVLAVLLAVAALTVYVTFVLLRRLVRLRWTRGPTGKWKML